MRIVSFVLLALAGSVALAQPKPALVQGRDEPARQPWSQLIQVTQNAANCGPLVTLCSADFDTVPAGKRLVVTHASVLFSVDDPQGVVAYTGPAQIPNFAHIVPLTQAVAGRYAGGGPILYFVEPGSAPYFIATSLSLSDGLTSTFALSGYFIDLP